MSIVSRVYKKKRGDVYMVVCDDCKFPINTEILSRIGVTQGDEFSQDELSELVSEFFIRYFEERALKLISIRSRSQKEIRDYLSKIRYKQRQKMLENIEPEWEKIENAVIDKLADINLLNDEEFARLFVESRIAMRPRSVYMMKMELMKKGVDSDVATRVLDEVVEDESELVKAVLTKKYGSDDLYKDDEKKIKYLQGKGFNWHTISQVFQE